MKKNILNIVLSVCFLFFLTPAISARAASDIYVDYINGNDSNSGAEEAPLKTVNVAVDMAEAGDTIILKGTSAYIEPLGSTDDPLVIDKALTITGSDESAPVKVSARCGGIILGADVSFGNMSFGVASFLRTGIAANGHSLTLTNVFRAEDLRELQIYGGTFFDYSDVTKDFGAAYRGDKSTIRITGGNIPVVYAGSVNGGFDKDVSIEVAKADGEMTLGTIYACSAKKVAENDVAGSIPSPSVDYIQSGTIDVDIDGAPVEAVNGARNEESTASVFLSVNSSQTYSCELSKVDELTVEGGIFAPEGELAKQITIGNGENVATLDLASQLTESNPVIDRLQCNTGSILVLDRYGSLTISDSHTGSAELRAGGGMPYSSESVPGYSGIMEYEHTYINYGKTGNTGTFTIDKPYPSQVGCISFQEEHTQGWTTCEEPFDIIELETFDIADTKKTISYEAINGLEGESTPKIPVNASFSEDTTFAELACIPFSCKVTYGGREYVQTAVTDEYGYYSCSIPELTLFLEFMGDVENTETVFMPRLILNSEGNRVSTGTYEIEITMPVTSEFVTDCITLMVVSQEDDPTDDPSDDPSDDPTDDPTDDPSDDPTDDPAANPEDTPDPTPIGPQPSNPSQDWPFTDVAVNPGNWKYDAVKFVYDNKIMNGVGDGTSFDPDAPLTREMFATVLYRMAGEPSVTYTAKFPDVPSGKWYSNAVIWASEQGIVNGYGSGNFGTGHYITREQIAKMLNEYGKKQGYDVSQRADFGTFADAASISGWANDYMKWAVGSGMISGSKKDGKYYLNPQGNATRAESATMLRRFMEKYE